MMNIVCSGKVRFHQPPNATGKGSKGFFVIEVRTWTKEDGERIDFVNVVYPEYLENQASRLVEEGKFVGITADSIRATADMLSAEKLSVELWVLARSLFLL